LPVRWLSLEESDKFNELNAFQRLIYGYYPKVSPKIFFGFFDFLKGTHHA